MALSFGECVEQILLALAYNQPHSALTHLSLALAMQSDAVEQEIGQALAKKVLQSQRLTYLSVVNSVAVSVNKKIKLKGVNYSSVVVELFGEGSNILNDAYNTYSEHLHNDVSSVHAIIQTINDRIFDIVASLMKSYYEDKAISAWYLKFKNNESLNFQVLDNLLFQLGSIRSTIDKYVSFTRSKFAEYELSDKECAVVKELEMHCTSLEYGYLSAALSDALSSKAQVLQVETGVYVCQAIEDAFFILLRSLERALLTQSSAVIASVLAKLLETLDTSSSAHSDYLSVYAMLADHQFYVGIMPLLREPRYEDRASDGAAKEEAERPAAADTIMSSPLGYLGSLSKSIGIASGVLLDEDERAQCTPVRDLAVELKYAADLKYDTHWLRTQYSAPSSSIDELLRSALDMDAYSQVEDANPIVLNMSDSCVHVNTLVIAVRGVRSMVELVEDSVGGGVPSAQMLTMLLQELRKLSGVYAALLHDTCDVMARELLEHQARRQLVLALQRSYEMSGAELDEIAGSTTVLVLCARALCTTAPTHVPLLLTLKSQLSSEALFELLSSLASAMTHCILENILKTAFSEFGSILFQQEVYAIMDAFDSLLEGDRSIRPQFSKLLWITKLLTLDSPADVRRYSIPRNILSEDQARSLLRLRTEFSKEAVAKVKLNML